MNPYLATLFTFAIGFLRLMDFLAHRGVIESRLSRKLIHIGTGPIFVLCWLMSSRQLNLIMQSPTKLLFNKTIKECNKEAEKSITAARDYVMRDNSTFTNYDCTP